jgi:uncharacterized protein YkuJ
VATPPAKTVYGQGQELNPSGLDITAQFKKNTEEVKAGGQGLLPGQGWPYSGYDKSRPGKQTVTVTMNATAGLLHRSATATFEVTVIPVENITIAQPPFKTSFRQGDNPDWSGLKVNVTFKGQAVPDEMIGPRQAQLSGYNKDQGGSQTITVNYYGQRATFDVKVAALTEITVKSPPENTLYYLGEELSQTELAGLSVVGTWNDGSTAQVNITGQNLSGYDVNREGEQIVIVSYSGKTATFPVTFKVFDSLSVTPPSKVEYLPGEQFNTRDIRVYGTLDGKSVYVRNPIIGKCDTSREGPQHIIVTAGGKSTFFTIRIINPFVGEWDGSYPKGLLQHLTMYKNHTWVLTTTEPDGKREVVRGTYKIDIAYGKIFNCPYADIENRNGIDNPNAVPWTGWVKVYPKTNGMDMFSGGLGNYSSRSFYRRGYRP